MQTTRRMIVPAQHDQLARLAAMVAEAAIEVGFDDIQVNRIELAVDEACANIIDHAYQGKPGTIEMDITIDVGHQIAITLLDYGDPFDVEQVSRYEPCETVDEVKIGGLGVHLMRQAMDDVSCEYLQPAGANRLTMTKRL